MSNLQCSFLQGKGCFFTKSVLRLFAIPLVLVVPSASAPVLSREFEGITRRLGRLIGDCRNPLRTAQLNLPIA